MADFAACIGRTGPVVRTWTETEMVATDIGRLGTDVWTAFTTALVERIRAAGPPGLDPGVAALALVAMIERANYYVLTGQVAGADGRMADTLARVVQDAIFGPGSGA
jgi:hypothetical protein